ITMDYTSADGTAMAGTDYTATSGTLTFAPGETSKSVAVNVLGDNDYEPDETVKLEIADLGNTYRGTGTITNDDSQPAVSVAPTPRPAFDPPPAATPAARPRHTP